MSTITIFRLSSRNRGGKESLFLEQREAGTGLHIPPDQYSQMVARSSCDVFKKPIVFYSLPFYCVMDFMFNVGYPRLSLQPLGFRAPAIVPIQAELVALGFLWHTQST